MNDLTIIDYQGKKAIDSRQVAEMTEKNHADLLRSIKGYVVILTESNFAVSDFFIESTYQDSTGRTLHCYLITRKGCDMVANKMTGKKGVLFTAAYVTKFEEMEKQVTAHKGVANPLEIMQGMLTEVIRMDKQVKNIEKRQFQQIEAQTLQSNALNQIRETVCYRPDSWRKDVTKLITTVGMKRGGPKYLSATWKELYALINSRLGVCLEQRITRKHDRLKRAGATQWRLDHINHFDVISDDKKLIEGCISIAKELAIKYV